jgi:hypothetical protein
MKTTYQNYLFSYSPVTWGEWFNFRIYYRHWNLISDNQVKIDTILVYKEYTRFEITQSTKEPMYEVVFSHSGRWLKNGAFMKKKFLSKDWRKKRIKKH